MRKQAAAIAAIATTGLLFAAPTFAQVAPQTEPVAAEAMLTVLEGKVMVVNTDTRMMTIKTADGDYEVLHVPPEVTRLDGVKIGDMVSITETTSVLIEIQSGGGDDVPMGADSSTVVEPVPGGKRPAGTITDTLTLYGKIVGVDKAGGTVTIKGAETTRTFPVEDQALLDELKVGDGVVASFRNVISGEVTVR